MAANWVDVAVELRQAGTPWSQMPDRLAARTGKVIPRETIRSAVRRAGIQAPKPKPKPKQDTDLTDVVLHALKRGATVDDLAERVDRSPGTVRAVVDRLRADGYDIDERDGVMHLKKVVAGTDVDSVHREPHLGGVIRFGAISDTHLCSRHQQLTHLHAFYDLLERRGITTVYHAGDICEGQNLFRGHLYETFRVGSDDQVEYVAEHYPQRDGVVTKFITGNHDLSFYKTGGRDIGRAIAQERDDLHYLGQFSAWVEIADGIWLYLLHPDGGGAYSVSYRPQKLIESFLGGSKPNVMLIGHYHQAEYLFERNIHCLQTASFQGQTSYLIRKGLKPKMGGWIVEMEVGESGITRFAPEFVPFYVPVKDDF